MDTQRSGKKLFSAETRKLRKLRAIQRTQDLFNRERLMRRLRDARSEADAVENYLSNLIPAYRQAAEAEAQRKRLVEMIPQIFRGRPLGELLQQDPTSYRKLREAVR